MFRQDETYLASLVFHELAHQRVYVHGDSAFNEAFAVAVETSGVRKWLRAAGDSAGLRRYEAERKRNADFLALMAQTRNELSQLYAGPVTLSHKRAEKAAAIERLRSATGRCATAAGTDTGATMPGSAARSTTPSSPRPPSTTIWCRLPAPLRPVFGDYPRFYAAVRQLGALGKGSGTRS